MEELEYIASINLTNEAVTFFDDAFTLMPNRAKTICERINSSKIKRPLKCITRYDKVDKELLDLMKAAGFVSIGFSLESATPHVLRNRQGSGPQCKMRS